MELHAGILIIGSLYWDITRKPWRAKWHAPREESIVDKAGMLKIDWPKWVTGRDPKELDALDLLLATANDPTLKGGEYPTPQLIAKAWKDAPAEVRYFRKNRKNGIETFQDELIDDLLKTADPRQS